MPLREELSADDLPRLDQASQDASQSCPLLALAMIYEGASRMDVTRTGAVSLQMVRN